MNGFDLSTIIDAKLGAVSLDSIYLGSNKLWPTIPPDPYSLIPVTIENVSNGYVALTVTAYGSGSYTTYYSDPFDENMNPPDSPSDSTDVSGSSSYNFITLSPGEMVRLWAEDNNSVKSSRNYYSITSDGEINIYGNIKSLLDKDNKGLSMAKYCLSNIFNGAMVVDASHLVLPDTTLAEYCYSYMFYKCTSLTTAPELPATTLAGSCYRNMFYNCTSLTTAPELPATTLTGYCYQAMFQGCSLLTTAPNLPATTLANACYRSMFQGCSLLTTAPELPATTLAGECYNSMFYGCTSLTTAPELPATTLTNICYNSMFNGCTSLTTAPELPATTLTGRCYNSMFRNCTSLQYIKCLATNISASQCTNYMMDNVAATGTFVKPASMTSWTSGQNGIPSGWTVIDV